VLSGPGIDPTGATDSTAALQTKINANPGQILLLPPGVFAFSSLTLGGGQQLVGSGWRDLRDATSTFGTAGWSTAGTFAGTVLRSTATTGVAITVVDSGGRTSQGGVSEFVLIGPGSGTAVGLQMGTGTTALVGGIVRNVQVANFATGVLLVNAEEGSFYNLSAHGCTLGVELSTATNNNGFYGLDLQRCGDGLHIDAGAGCLCNAFYSPIAQSNTGNGFVLNGNHNVILNPYLEANGTTGVTVNGGRGNTIVSPVTATATDKLAIGASAAETLVLGMDNGGTTTIPMTNAGSNSTIHGNTTLLTDTGTGTLILDPRGTPWTSYTPVLGGTNGSTGSALGNGSTSGGWTRGQGRTIHFWARVDRGSTTTWGTVGVRLTLPVQAASANSVNITGTVFRTGVGTYALSALPGGGASTDFQAYVIGTGGAFQPLTDTAPWTPASGDYVLVQGSYEAAS
jgi:hypothetical protein